MCSGAQVLKAKTCHNLEPTISLPNSPKLSHSPLHYHHPNSSWKFVHCRVVCLQTLHFVSNFLHCVHDAGAKRGNLTLREYLPAVKHRTSRNPHANKHFPWAFEKNTTRTHGRSHIRGQWNTFTGNGLRTSPCVLMFLSGKDILKTWLPQSVYHPLPLHLPMTRSCLFTKL